jgi:hypothetical protein
MEWKEKFQSDAFFPVRPKPERSEGVGGFVFLSFVATKERKDGKDGMADYDVFAIQANCHKSKAI